MRHLLTSFILVLLGILSSPASSDQSADLYLSVSGKVAFGTTSLRKGTHRIRSTQTPTIKLYVGTNEGFRLQFESSGFSDAKGHRLNSGLFTLRASGGSIEQLAGFSAPLETENVASLRDGAVALRALPGVEGRFSYKPRIDAFELEIPASAYAGNYIAEVKVTLLRGP